MKKNILLWCMLGIPLFSFGQKKALDHSVYDNWKRINNPLVSTRGTILSYEIQPQQGDGELVIQNTTKKSKITINRGYKATLTPNERFAICLIKPPYEETRQAKIKKKKGDELPKDSLAIVSLKNGTIKRFGNVLSYKIAPYGNTEVAFLSADTALVTKSDRKKKKIGKPLLVYHFNTETCDTLTFVDQYQFDDNGHSLAITTLCPKKESSIRLYNLPDCKKPSILNDTLRFYTLPHFDETGNKLLFLASPDTMATGSKRCALFYYEKGTKQPQELIASNYHQNLPQGWGLNENSKPFFNRNTKQIFVGIAPIRAPKDTTIVDFENAELDVWNYNDKMLPPAQLKNVERTLKKTALAVYQPQSKSLLPLTTSFFDRISLLNEGNSPIALSIDETNHLIESQWNDQTLCDLALINLQNGKRTPISSGRYAEISASPNGNYIIWYNYPDRQWYLYDISQAKTRCLTEKIEAHFWDEQHDTPNHPEAYGIAGWTTNDQDVLLYDRFDLWKISTDGRSVINLTKGEGRRTNRTFRYISPESIESGNKKAETAIKEKEFIDFKQVLLLSVFDHTTKKRGYATLKGGGKQAPELEVLDGFTFSTLKKAKENNTYIYQKANFQTSPDIYTTTNLWKSEQKRSDINPQMKEYSWGTAELFKWHGYDGTPLEGLLYKPENFDPNKKYPVILYFYERRSDNLYAHYTPEPSWSTINISFYCSRGYVVFVPDIVYKTGIPGECAYNCIVSGAETLARNPWVDQANMGIQGQSWGGYQVAYLITRTNLFKAAEAGAPVANMTSAYGGIRWGTGMSRQFQYECTQSRIGRTLWDAPELYISNSPLFRANHVKTPLLIMHNDKDGAVPWYQGVEYFMALRRLGKPVWMLQYNDEDHNLVERRNRKDLTIRLQQYFDHYLKGAPMPAWMKQGIPAERKGEYFGLETD